MHKLCICCSRQVEAGILETDLTAMSQEFRKKASTDVFRLNPSKKSK